MYKDDNPVLSIRVPKFKKKLLQDVADDMGISLTRLCAGILVNYTKQSELFEIVYKGDKSELEV